jgi:hypothetical protein
VDTTVIPQVPGVYVVVYPGQSRPAFLTQNIAGHFKGKDPTVELITLSVKWVDGAKVIYVGKADARRRGGGLRERIREFQRYGAGEPVGHSGGAYVWQLAESANLLIAWRATGPGERPATVEVELIDAFYQVHDALPFANRNRGHRPRTPSNSGRASTLSLRSNST